MNTHIAGCCTFCGLADIFKIWWAEQWKFPSILEKSWDTLPLEVTQTTGLHSEKSIDLLMAERQKNHPLPIQKYHEFENKYNIRQSHSFPFYEAEKSKNNLTFSPESQNQRDLEKNSSQVEVDQNKIESSNKMYDSNVE